MTPAARATALIVAALVAAFAAAASGAFLATGAVLRRREDRRARPRHAGIGRHRDRGRREFAAWAASVAVRFVRDEDGGPKAAVTFASLFVAFACLIGVSQ